MVSRQMAAAVTVAISRRFWIQNELRINMQNLYYRGFKD